MLDPVEGLFSSDPPRRLGVSHVDLEICGAPAHGFLAETNLEHRPPQSVMIRG